MFFLSDNDAATECLQEEVFVFTNKIALVVHSICHSYGGSANKNIGDAFLVSWILDDRPPEEEEDDVIVSYQTDRLYANSNQADKALLSVVKISMALQYDNYFVESMKEDTKNRLIKKFSKRKGPLVQMGFGLHAGKAVQGAIGSTRKLDATYISESVERAEFLESSTKKYGVPLLMSEAFYNLLDSTNKYRCRKVDQLLLFNEDECISDIADVNERIEHGEKMNLYTFDMDIAALWRVDDEDNASVTSSVNEIRASTSSRRQRTSIRDHTRKSMRYLVPRRSSSNLDSDTGGETHHDKHFTPSKELILPIGPCEYNDRCWLAPDIKAIRRTYVSNGIAYPMFESGLIAFYGSQWEHAKHCFQTVLAQMDDGPSRYFIKMIDEHDGIPPPDFIGYGVD
jgi:class 3 adenylate cyclase